MMPMPIMLLFYRFGEETAKAQRREGSRRNAVGDESLRETLRLRAFAVSQRRMRSLQIAPVPPTIPLPFAAGILSLLLFNEAR
jgi:hypothetical protein